MDDDIRTAICEKANALLPSNSPIKVLEAGCGSATHVRFSGLVHTVGIDVSGEQLEKNTTVHEKILGDIQDYPLPKEEFDIAVCWMVLEHLSRPKDALLNLFGSLKPGGLLVVAIPNLLSLKGIATKITPFWVHVLFYKFMKYKSHPFPTYLRLAIVPKKLMQFAADNGFRTVFCRFVQDSLAKMVQRRFWSVGVALSVAESLAGVISFGKFQSLLLDNCFIILRKGKDRDLDRLPLDESECRYSLLSRSGKSN
jgi:SAM-dependent methyltransferase